MEKMDIKLDHLPVIDKEKALFVAGNKESLANELLTGLTKTISADLYLISHLYQEQNYRELLHKVHRLHGAICYCGLPRLKVIMEKLETELKLFNNEMDAEKTKLFPALIDLLQVEVTNFLEHA